MISPFTYVLDERTVVAEPNRDAWQAWLAAARERDEHVVAKTQVSASLEVSTVFMGIDHALGDGPPGGAPVVFETTVFQGGKPGRKQRYSTWDQALQGHQGMVASLQS
jgi:hypothetical protein